MKLRNKKTGEIKNVNHNKVLIHFNDGQTECINSLAELNSDWEDYEEPKEYWSNDQFGEPINVSGLNSLQLAELKRIDNLFLTKEEAEKAVEKLKAWKRLKDKGFRFKDWNASMCELYFDVPDSFFPNDNLITDETREDLDLLFGGEE